MPVFIGPLSGSIGGAQQLFGYINYSGEFLVFSGEYPGSSTWNLIGKWRLPRIGHTHRPFIYIRDIPHIITYAGIYNLAQIVNTGDIRSANIGNAVRDQLIDAGNIVQSSYEYYGDLVQIPCQVNINNLPADTKAILIYNSQMGTWSVFIPNSTNKLYNVRTCANFNPQTGYPYIAGISASDNKAYVMASATIGNPTESFKDDNAAFYANHVTHSYRQYDKPQMKYAEWIRPFYQLSSGSINGNYVLNTDTIGTSSTYISGYTQSATDKIGYKNYPINASGYYFAPALNVTPTAAGALRYYGSLLSYHFGGTL